MRKETMTTKEIEKFNAKVENNGWRGLDKS